MVISIVTVMWTLLRWQRGIYGLLAFVPFAGVVSMAFHRWTPLGVLAKDLLFILPAYIAFLGCMARRGVSLRGLPVLPVALLFSLALLVLLQMANPGVRNLLMALIGAKVWLLYLPLMVMTFAMVESTADLYSLFRLMAVTSLIPCGIGIAEAVLVQVIGYRQTMQTIYGAEAVAITQSFSQSDIGGGFMPRIPSTFTFVTQFFGYTLSMIIPAYVVWRGDSKPAWRQLGRVSLLAATLACLLSGARAAFVFVPIIFLLTFGFERGARSLLVGSAYAAMLFMATVITLGIPTEAIYRLVADLFVKYSEEVAYGGFVQAMAEAPLGHGVGTNTVAARYALPPGLDFRPIENYYAKAVWELGLPGLLLVLVLFTRLPLAGYRIRGCLKNSRLKVAATGLCGYVVVIGLNNFKGTQVDLDPVNVYLWVFAGMLLKLPLLEPIGRSNGVRG
jgi:hypothetical protein